MSTVITNNPRILLIGLSLSLFIFETLISLTNLNFSIPHSMNPNLEIFPFHEVISVLFLCIKSKKGKWFCKNKCSLFKFSGKKKEIVSYGIDVAIMSWMQFSELPASPEDTKFLIFGHFFFVKQWSPLLNYLLWF